MKDLITIEVTIGKIPSLNQFYAGKHWIVRKKYKDQFRSDVIAQLELLDPIQFESCIVKLRSNYRYDVDNTIMAVKFAVDALRSWGGIPDDTPKYIPKITLEHDPELEKNTAVIQFVGPVKFL